MIKLKNIIFVFLFGMILMQNISANRYTDSLLNILEEGKATDKQKAVIYGNLAWEYTHIKLDSAFYYAEKELAISEKIKNDRQYCDALNTLGMVARMKGDYRGSLNYYQRCLKKYYETKDTLSIAAIYNNIGIIYQYQKNYKLALKYHKNGLKYYSIGKNNLGIANSMTNMGLTYAYMKDYRNAEKYYRKTIRIKEFLGDQRGLANAYINLGSMYWDQKNYGDAEVAFEMALGFVDSLNDAHAYYVSLGNTGQTNIYRGNTEEGIKRCLQTYRFAEENQYADMLATCFDCLYLGYKNQGNMKDALFYLEKLAQYKDSNYNDQLSADIAMKEAQFEYSMKFSKDSLKHAQEKELNDAVNLKNQAEIEKNQITQYALFGGLGLTLLFTFFIYNRFMLTKRQKDIIVEKERETHLQKHIIEEKNKEIIDSINYAKRIQYTLLAHEDFLKANLHEHFVLFMPKDIVSGDFYWCTKKDNDFYLAVCDCTGHGVPGAFMSLLNISLLNEAISEINIREPHLVLNFVRDHLIQTMEGSKDGMDAILIRFTGNKMQYAAAHNHPILIRNGELKELPADKMPVGKGENNNSFALHEIELQKDDLLFFYTDGYADQFGGPKGKKFKYANLQQLLLKNSNLELSTLNLELSTVFDNWKGDLEQVDDVCIVGVRI